MQAISYRHENRVEARHFVYSKLIVKRHDSRWFSNTSFTTGLKTLPTFRPDALVYVSGLIFALKKTRASGRNVGKVFNPVVKLVLENQPFLMNINIDIMNMIIHSLLGLTVLSKSVNLQLC